MKTNNYTCEESWCFIKMSSNSSDDDLKNITIRGVDMEIYDNFINKIRDYNLNVGEAFNKMISDVLNDFDDIFQEENIFNYLELQKRLPKLNISSHKELVVSNEDLLATKSRIVFSHIEILKFDTSVTKEAFLKHVKRVHSCNLVQFGEKFPKLLALAYCVECDTIEFAD